MDCFGHMFTETHGKEMCAGLTPGDGCEALGCSAAASKEEGNLVGTGAPVSAVSINGICFCFKIPN